MKSDLKMDTLFRNIAKQLKKAIEEKDISISELAKKADVSDATLSRILSGEANPSFDKIVRIAKSLEISLDKLTGLPIKEVESNAPTLEQEDYSNETDILASFEISDTDLTPSQASRMLTSAANGTWIAHPHDSLFKENTPRVKPIFCMQTGTRKICVDLAFPHTYVEEGSIASLIGVIGSALSGTQAKLMDIRIPTALVRTFKAPFNGRQSILEKMSETPRPLLSVTMRPMTGLTPQHYADTVYKLLKNGVDFTCDPTMMHSLPEHDFRERVNRIAEVINELKYEESLRNKHHMVNVSAATTEEVIDRARHAVYAGLKYLLIDTSATGFSTLQSLRKFTEEHDVIIAAMGARGMQTATMSEQVIAKLLRFAGADIVSIPSPLGESFQNSRRQVKGTILSLIGDDPIAQDHLGLSFDQPTLCMKQSIPAVGGGHNPWHFPRIIDTVGAGCIIQCGANVMSHPNGIEAGAKANIAAVTALMEASEKGRSLAVEGKKILQEAAKHNEALKEALKHWSEGAFLFGVIEGDKQNLQGTIKVV